MKRSTGWILRPDRWLIEAVVVTVLVLIGLSAVSGWKSADAVNQFPSALLLLPPTPQPGTDFTSITAQSLEKVQPYRAVTGLQVDYVSPDRASTGALVVSVHPIDASTWAAAALGSNGHCYAVLVLQPSSYQTYYARFPAGTPCKGNEANGSTVRLTNLPE